MPWWASVWNQICKYSEIEIWPTNTTLKAVRWRSHRRKGSIFPGPHSFTVLRVNGILGSKNKPLKSECWGRRPHLRSAFSYTGAEEDSFKHLFLNPSSSPLKPVRFPSLSYGLLCFLSLEHFYLFSFFTHKGLWKPETGPLANLSFNSHAYLLERESV